MLQTSENFEKWKSVVGYENEYKISSQGRVYSFYSNRFLKPGINRLGYKHVSLFKNQKGTTWKVHKLVALAFIPNPENKIFIDHIDRNRLNNNVSNLRWVTPKENRANVTKKEYIFRPRPSSGRAVRCIETNKVYVSAAEAERQTKVKAYSITKACNTMAGGYHWEYVNNN